MAQGSIPIMQSGIHIGINTNKQAPNARDAIAIPSPHILENSPGSSSIIFFILDIYYFLFLLLSLTPSFTFIKFLYIITIVEANINMGAIIKTENIS